MNTLSHGPGGRPHSPGGCPTQWGRFTTSLFQRLLAEQGLQGEFTHGSAFIPASPLTSCFIQKLYQMQKVIFFPSLRS